MHACTAVVILPLNALSPATVEVEGPALASMGAGRKALGGLGWDAGEHGNVTGDVTGPFGALWTSAPIWATRYEEPEARIAAVEGGRPESRIGCLLLT